MEYFWYVIAALGAGVTTGLVGLSAAAVMVPILIVLCPTFAVTGGQFQAVAIALASDVLASVVSTAIYIRHKNIDLKRSWIVLVCVVATCILGTIVSYFFTPPAVSEYASLGLCIFIGVRFLIQPDPKSKRLIAKGENLDKKGIIISVLFGLVIGFIVGFVGTGGGLMMLLVFTLFLGMERRTAVGTSTFIMAIAALIAFGAHSVTEVAILLDHWKVLAICAPVATFGAVVSSLFANKVNGKVVGIVTGAILTLLGTVLLILHAFALL